MDSEEREKLERALLLAEKNNDILEKMDSRMKWQMVFKILRWVVVIGLGIVAFYFIQPVFQDLLNVYGNIGQGMEGINGFLHP